jgi:hypothetical protein
MAFYNGMMPGITKMVESFAGDAASQKGYRQAASAEAAIAGARKDNMETPKNTMEWLPNDIRQIQEDNKETLDQINLDAQYEIDEINKKNMAN